MKEDAGEKKKKTEELPTPKKIKKAVVTVWVGNGGINERGRQKLINNMRKKILRARAHTAAVN